MGSEGTQHLSKAEAEEIIDSGRVSLEPLFLQAGDVVIADPRTLHRGSPNWTDAPRPFLAIVHNRHWYHTEHDEQLEANEGTLLLMDSFYQTLSPREKDLLQRVRRTQG